MTKGNKCDNCGKGVMYGHNVSHAKNRTRRIFKPNLHKARILRGAAFITMKLCTKCLRLLKGKVKKSSVRVAQDKGSKVEVLDVNSKQPQIAAA